MKKLPLSSRMGPVAFLLALAALPARAATIDWADTNGGLFSLGASWTGGLVPGATDNARFLLTGTYTVFLGANATNDMITVDNGNVTFALGGNTYLLDLSGTSTVGSADGTTGRLTLTHGRLESVAGSTFTIGSSSADAGIVTVGTDAVLDWGSILNVGNFGTGTLAVQSGGRVETGGTLTVGMNPTGLGTMTVSGAGSTAALATLSVGNQGTGSFSVSSAGAVTVDGNGTLGNNATGNGSIAVSGSGSTLEIVGHLSVGDLGHGVLQVTSGGVVDVTSFFAGNQASASGEILVSGTGSRMETGTGIVGSTGTGTLDINSGGTMVSTGVATVGGIGGSNGTATVSGTTASWNLSNNLFIGAAGTGRLTITGGGTVSKTGAGVLTIGQQTTGTGTLTVTGTGSDLVSTSAVTVGSSGSGTLLVSEGGFVSTTGGSSIAGVGVFTSIGSATITGAGSLWRNTGSITVGNATGGNGALTAGSGGTVEVIGSLTLVDPAAATATLNVQPGGTVRCSSFSRGAGVLNLNGGMLEVNGGPFSNGVGVSALSFSGSDAASPPLLRLTGPAATTANLSTLTLGTGAGNAAELEVIAGAQCTPAGAVTIGGSAGVAHALVDGAASALDSGANGLTLGSAIPGTSTLTVSGGGRAAGSSISAGASGTVGSSAVVTGPGSSLTTAGTFNLGTTAAASLDVLNGGIVTAGTFTAGQTDGSTGTVTVDGPDSLIQAGTINFGSGGAAGGLVSSGGRLSCTSGSIAPGAAAVGSVTVTGSGSEWECGTLSIGTATSGSARLSVFDGGSVTATTLTLEEPAGGPNGSLILDGGSVSCGTFTRRGVLVFRDGVLSVGTFLNNGSAATSLTLNGSNAGDLPHLVLRTNAGSTNISTLTVGSDRSGALSVESQADLECTALHAGAQGTGSGTLAVRGAGGILCTTLSLGGNGSTQGGSGSLTIEQGGTVNCTDFHLHNGGFLTIDGGSLSYSSLSTATRGRVDFRSGDLVAAGGIFNDTAITTFLGPSRELLAGRTVRGGVALQSSGFLVINGGTLEGNPHVSNTGEIALRSETSTILGITTNNGVLRGTGRIAGPLDNQSSGQVRIAASQRLMGTGSLTNAGVVDINGGELELAGTLLNHASSGHVTARDAILWLNNGLDNSGTFSVPAGVTDVFGDVTNQSGGRIVVSGGATAIFYDDVTNSGTMNVSASGSLVSAAIFLGSLSGGGIGGAGHKFIEGDARPGASPGVMAFGGDVTFGPFSKLHIELAGASPGTQYDRVTVAGEVQWDGALEVTLLSGFMPSAGQSFDILDAGTSLGAFTYLTLPALPAGLYWHTDRLYIDGTISVRPFPCTFGDYAAQYGLNGGPHDDDDGDGENNVIEYLLGQHPMNNTLNGGPFSTWNGSQLTFTFSAPVQPGCDAVYFIETATTLTGWTPRATRSGNTPWTGSGAAAITTTPGAPGMENVTLTITPGPATRIQARLRGALAP